MTLLPARLRRKSNASSTNTLLSEKHAGERGPDGSSGFVVDPDAPPVPSALHPTSHTTQWLRSQAQAQDLSRSQQSQEEHLGRSSRRNPTTSSPSSGKVYSRIPDTVLLRVLQHIQAESGHAAPTTDSATFAATYAISLSEPKPIQTLARCALVNRRFNKLASPIIYRSLSYHDGYRHDPFLDMQSSVVRSAIFGLSRLLQPRPSKTNTGAKSNADPDAYARTDLAGDSAKKSLGMTRKAFLLSTTHTLQINYHWHSWCSPRPSIPNLPDLRTLRIDLNDTVKDNALHVDRKSAPSASARRACSMLKNLMPRDTIVIRGISMWSDKSVWSHLGEGMMREVRRVIYVCESTRPVSRGMAVGATAGEGSGSEPAKAAAKVEGKVWRGLPGHLAKQPKMRKGQDGEVVLVFNSKRGQAFELDCEGKEPNRLVADAQDELHRVVWVGGLIRDLADVLSGSETNGVGKITIVNADALCLPRASGAGFVSSESSSDTFVRLLRQRLTVALNSIPTPPRTHCGSASVPEIRGMTMKQYLRTTARDREFDESEVRGWVMHDETDWSGVKLKHGFGDDADVRGEGAVRFS